MSKDKDRLYKKAQALLLEAKEKLRLAAELAEQGKFELWFSGGHYIPKSATGGADSEDDMTSEQRDELETHGIFPYEYQVFGKWWEASNC